MKTFKKTVVVIGFITAIITLVSTSINAENLNKTEKKETTKKTIINQEELMETEQTLIGEYLETLKIPETAIEESIILVYDTEGQLVFKGEASNAQDMLNRSSLLIKFDNEKLYTLY